MYHSRLLRGKKSDYLSLVQPLGEKCLRTINSQRRKFTDPIPKILKKSSLIWFWQFMGDPKPLVLQKWNIEVNLYFLELLVIMELSFRGRSDYEIVIFVFQ